MRDLSDGNRPSSPPPSPGINTTKYKLAEHRYGREEMLALYRPSSGIPEKLKEFPAILCEKPLQPLAFISLTEEEAVSLCLNYP